MNRHRKTSRQVKDYKRSISYELPEETTGYNPVYSLIGSNEVSSVPEFAAYDHQRIAPKSLKLVITDFFSNHFIAIVISAILIPFLSWLLMGNITNDKNIAEISIKIESINKTLVAIQGSAATKDVVSMQLALLKSELTGASSSEIEIIKYKISLLEQIVQALQEEDDSG